MKNTKARQPDPVSGTVAHNGVDKPMNDPMGTASDAAADLDSDKLANEEPTVTYTLTDSDEINPDSLTNEMAADGQDNAGEGLTPIRHQNIDESRVDEVLVDESLNDDDYPSIRDIADNNAVSQSFEDE